uniref:Uncharacterized protein n=1 Tax=Lepeophtheirus salmonis TaxID=72036 RepID=A0A0K2V207_LEPSM
MSENVLCIFIL